MLRKISLLVITIFFLWLPITSQAQIRAGVHYMELPFGESVSSGNKVEVREFFWYGCPHCYTFEPRLNRWLKTKPVAVEFVRSPAFLAVTPDQAQNEQHLQIIKRFYLHARAYYAFEKLGLTHKVHKAFFDTLHKAKQPLNTLPQLLVFVSHYGIDKAKFQAAMNSFSVDSYLGQSRQLEIAYNINSVPNLVIDGRFLTSPTLAGSADNAIKVVDFLVKKVLRERRQRNRRK